MRIYVTREGQNYGPYTIEQAHVMIHQGQLYPGDLACPEGSTDWVPLGQILGIPPTNTTRHAVPVAQPATAIHPPVVDAAPRGGLVPGSLAARFAVRDAYKRACAAYAGLGIAAAFTVIGFGMPLITLAAGSGSGSGLATFFAKDMGMKWALGLGLPIALLSLGCFFAQKKKAAILKRRFEAMRGSGI